MPESIQEHVGVTRFPLDGKTSAEIEKNFKYHAPSGSQPERYVAVREKSKELAILIVQTGLNSRERSLALTHLEQAVMWANAGIARNG